MIRRALFIAFFALPFTTALSGCASDGTKPDDMSADEHRAAAAKERQVAEQHEEKFDPNATSTRPQDSVNRSNTVPGIDDVTWPEDVYNPTSPHKLTAEAHLKMAAKHEAAAAALEAYEDGVCKKISKKVRGMCPLLGPVSSVEDIDGGVRMHIRDGVKLQAIVDHMNCHMAYARTEGHKGMDECPLYLKGLTVKAGDGIVDLVTSDSGTVDELRKRAKTHAIAD